MCWIALVACWQDRRAINPTAAICYHTCEDTPDAGLGTFKLTTRNSVLCKCSQIEGKIEEGAAEAEGQGGTTVASKQDLAV